MIRFAIASLLAGGTVYANGATASESFWLGTADRGGATMSFQIRLTEGPDRLRGAIDLPDFYVLGMPLAESERRGERLRLGFGSGRIRHLLEGRIKGDTFEGTWHWTEEKFSCPFSVKRSSDPRPYTCEEVSFENGGVHLAGTVLTPKSTGPHAGIVLVHGSGDNERWWREAHADFFARHGLVALFFDKRGNGASTGDWKRVGFEPLAQDALAGVHLLQKRPDVDPARVGFWGISQAGWIMPLAASLEPKNVAFILTTSGAAVNVKDEGKYDYLVRVRDAAYPADVLERAEKILDLDHEVTMTGKGYEDLRALVLEARKEAWWKAFDFDLTPAGARAFPKLIGGFDPRPILEKIEVPILWMYGLADKSVEPATNIAILNEIMDKTSKPWTIKTFPDADHGIHLPYDPTLPFPRYPYAPGHWETMAEWLEQQGLASKQ